MKFSCKKPRILSGLSFLTVLCFLSFPLLGKPQAAYQIKGKTTTVQDLEKENQGIFYELEKRKYSQIESLAREDYLKSFWEESAKKQKISPEKAMANYIAKNVKVTEDEINSTLEKIKDHPRFKSIPKDEQRKQLKEILASQASRTLMDVLVNKAIAKGDLVINYPAPEEPRFSVTLTKDDSLRYGPKVTDTTPIKCKGNDCPIVVVEYSEFQCPFCSRVLDSTKKVLSDSKLKGKIVWTVRDFPLSFHDRAEPAAIAAKCSAFQGKYWQMYHKLFDNQRKLSDNDFNTYAKNIGLDMKKYDDCYKSPAKAKAIIDKNFSTGQKYGVTGTPAFFINGRRLSGALPYEEFMRVINDELKIVEAKAKKKPKKI